MDAAETPDVALKSSRFELRRKLGQGGMGTVREAFDRQTREQVALKTLHRFGTDARYRFKDEFRALADLQHPNLVRFGELHCEAGQWLFTMQLTWRSCAEKLRGDAVQAVASACEGLRRFGVRFAERPGKGAILRELVLLRLRQGRRPLATLAALPECRDERATCAMRLLAAVTAAAYCVDRTLLSTVLLKITSMSPRHGMSEHSAFGFAGYGMVMTGAFEQYPSIRRSPAITSAISWRHADT